MDIEKEQSDFESWWDKEGCYLGDISDKQGMKVAYQAARAALQSREAEDAERYRWIAKQKDVWAVLGDEYNLASEYEGANNLTEAIDHARRVEGER